MSRRKKKIVSATLTLKMSADEKMKLDTIAKKERRDLAEMVFWLIENYHNGNLDDVQKIVVGVERAMLSVRSRGFDPLAIHARVLPDTGVSDDKARKLSDGQ